MDRFRNDSKAYRRRNYFIDKKFQMGFIVKFLGVILAGSFLSGLLMYYGVSADIDRAFYSSHIKVASTGELIRPALFGANFGVLALVLFSVTALTAVFSMKLTGPLVRIGRSAEKIGEGDLTCDFRLRSGDEMKNLAGSFQEMNGALKGRFQAMKAQAVLVDRAASEVYELCSSREGRPADMEELLERMRAVSSGLKALRERLSGFQVVRQTPKPAQESREAR